MAAFLFFQLAGPMASWGEIAVGEDRGSATRPTRSAILGILASALGIRRDEEERQRALADGYRIAVIVCDPGELLRDYHTTQVPSTPDAKGWPLVTRRDEVDVMRWQRRTKGKGGEAILSFRDYRCDGRWIVAVQAAAGAPYSLREISRALFAPKLVLFLGRKSCPPALGLEPQVFEAESMLEGLARLSFAPAASFSGSKSRKVRSRENGLLPIYWDAGFDAGIEATETTERRDDPTSRRRWQFRPRVEQHASIDLEVLPCT